MALFYEPAGRTGRSVFLMHPRVDFTAHYLIPPLLRRGISVWAQNGRFVNNDLTLVHERLLLDIGAGMSALKVAAHDITLIGNSGGGSLAAFYAQQAARPPGDRLDRTPSGSRIDLAAADLPLPDRLALVAAHPGQGDWLAKAIDPAVVDETDPSLVDPGLDLYDEANGLGRGYDEAFVTRYREAQRSRVDRIDAIARELIAQRAAPRRAARAAQVIIVHRTDADPRCVDLSLDRSDRAGGSIFGRDPGRSNYGFAGLGRMSTPDAWLSTWSANTSQAALRLTLPELSIPLMHISYTADQSVFPSDTQTARAVAPTLSRTLDLVADHYGFSTDGSERAAAEPVSDALADWR